MKVKYCSCGCGKKLKNPQKNFILGHHTKLCPPKTKWKKGNIPWNKGLTKETDERVKLMSEIPRTKEWKDKMSNARRGKKLGYPVWNKGLFGVQPSNKKGLTMEEYYGEKKAKKIKNKIRSKVKDIYSKDDSYRKRIVPKNQKAHINEHLNEVMNEIGHLSSQGFRCVQLVTKPRPDIIAVKDGKIFAVEVDMLHNIYDSPDYKKYTNINYFDDIYWVTKKSKFWDGRE